MFLFKAKKDTVQFYIKFESSLNHENGSLWMRPFMFFWGWKTDCSFDLGIENKNSLKQKLIWIIKSQESFFLYLFQIIDEGEEKIIHLTESELRKVVGDQIVSLLKLWKVHCYPLDQLMTGYMQHYGYYVPLHDLHVHTPQQLMAKLKHVLKVDAVKLILDL